MEVSLLLFVLINHVLPWRGESWESVANLAKGSNVIPKLYGTKLHIYIKRIIII